MPEAENTQSNIRKHRKLATYSEQQKPISKCSDCNTIAHMLLLIHALQLKLQGNRKCPSSRKIILKQQTGIEYLTKFYYDISIRAKQS